MIISILCFIAGFTLGAVMVSWLLRQGQEKSDRQMREAFEALGGQILKNNSDEFLKRSKDQLKEMVQPFENSLKSLDGQIRELEQKREGAYKGLGEQIKNLLDTERGLQNTTVRLEQALKAPNVRGSWSEMALQRVVELAGMTEHVSFDKQKAAEEGRPDMLIYLPNQGVLPVDSKAPMNAYMEAMQAADAETRAAKLKAHAKAVKEEVNKLSRREYWSQFERTPDFVAMFLPNDNCLAAAFAEDPDLLEYAIKQKVLLTTPVTLLALLKAVAYGWQQQQMTENARLIAEQGKDLYDRLGKFMDHFKKVGGGLDSAAKSYNDAVGSLESRLMPAARRFKELGALSEEVPAPQPVDRQVKTPSLEDPPDAESERRAKKNKTGKNGSPSETLPAPQEIN